MKKYITAFFACLLAGCATTPPKGVEVVTNFDLNRYLGTWHEIARLDHKFEKNLTSVTAEYSLREDGGVNVVNRGYSLKEKKWKEAKGRAYFTGPANEGALKVSFFRPFYGGYNIIDLAGDYSYALVAGPSHEYLWILARTPALSMATKDMLVTKARVLGFPAEEMIFPGQRAPLEK